MSIFSSEDRKIRKEIKKRAFAIAEEHYRKEVMFQSLQSSDFHYAILFDLMKAAQLTGKVTVEMKDGTKILIEDDKRAELNKLDQSPLY